MTSPATQARGLETRRRVLDAAMAEFARHGVDGARINRIAERARASKERIYAWFGDKDALFDTVMEVGLEELSRVVPITPDLVDYTVRLHDTFAARPDLQRIAAWAWLHERGRAEQVSEKRVTGYRHKIAVIRDAQRAGLVDPEWPPHHLLAALIAVATSWLTAPVELHRALGPQPDSVDDARAQVRRAAQRLVRPPG
ncbi:TetR family transcriptional regulator [Micromonospora sp. RP3T]|uniref:TetR family transcriptional regulator n=1 Tax=Micromonospora sp. RP3T TaxID=2135446 RepID=UPI000D155975|nr:TetR family transcriptional regulator [Micromonospora sp. RP3T]PTA47825.1 TetR/AcrR family transcriptional regulator [Micromonospora sp. RP3T]